MDGVVLGCFTSMPVLYITGQQVWSQGAASPVDLASLVLRPCWMGCTPRVGAEGRRRLSPGTGAMSPHPAWMTRGPCQARASWKGAGFQPLPTGLASPTSQAEPRQGNSAPKAANSSSMNSAKFMEQRLYCLQVVPWEQGWDRGEVFPWGMVLSWASPEWDAAFNLSYAP